jgi:hypothetical protein
MGSSFFLTVVTHYTVVSFIHHFPSPSQNVPCIQPIIEKKPGKKLDPRDASSFPNVKNCPTRPEFPELVSIKVATQKPTLPPIRCQESLELGLMGGGYSERPVNPETHCKQL